MEARQAPVDADGRGHVVLGLLAARRAHREEDAPPRGVAQGLGEATDVAIRALFRARHSAPHRRRRPGSPRIHASRCTVSRHAIPVSRGRGAARSSSRAQGPRSRRGRPPSAPRSTPARPTRPTSRSTPAARPSRPGSAPCPGACPRSSPPCGAGPPGPGSPWPSSRPPGAPPPTPPSRSPGPASPWWGGARWCATGCSRSADARAPRSSTSPSPASGGWRDPGERWPRSPATSRRWGRPRSRSTGTASRWPPGTGAPAPRPAHPDSWAASNWPSGFRVRPGRRPGRCPTPPSAARARGCRRWRSGRAARPW